MRGGEAFCFYDFCLFAAGIPPYTVYFFVFLYESFAYLEKQDIVI